MPSVRSHGAEIYYEVHGEGPTVAFAHGVAGNTLSWYRQVPSFARHHQVITFDHRGWGRSSCPPEMFHGRYWVTDLLAVLDAEGVERAALVGHSIGGWTALRMAIDHPERVSRLVLIASSGGLLTPRVLEGLTGGAMSVTREEDPWRRMLAPDFGEREPVLAHLHRQIQGLNPPLDPASVAQTVDVQVRPEELTGFAVPTLLVVGRCDAVFAPGVLEEATSPIAGVKTVALDGVGNSAHFEAPEAFNRLCADFIDARS